MRAIRSSSRRRGVAAVEMALVAPVLFGIVVGIWEVGRYVMVQNQLDNAAREGARLAASSAFFASTNHLDPSQSPNPPLILNSPSANDDYEVQKRVAASLAVAGIDTTGVTITVQNTGSTSNVKNWTYTYQATGSTGTGSGYDPAAAADQLDMLTVTITLPYDNVNWSLLGRFVSTSSTLTATANWRSMRNVPLVVSTTIPTQPIQPGEPLP